MKLHPILASNIVWCLRQKGYESYWAEVDGNTLVAYVNDNKTQIMDTWEKWEAVSTYLEVPKEPWVWRDQDGTLFMGDFLLDERLTESLRIGSNACKNSRRGKGEPCQCVCCKVTRFIKEEKAQ